ncbi:helix-turn-helix transcriptional regulator [Candidatus Nephthysia bennettiae]|uniref:Helix-turn-helix transcriptional regulator n=1 Tax=Candidatus Nephthysia bennettiae TaxID=3127016 RepID=A0A934NAW9_9BACT|nr:helix-turn-helix transcriptional regulator [Candidatus Dormibacteraeota bacterium]MBJ7611926.1 helix-turn-helix transcriptional regulator [Candidatus Dormibacteraeota bacterium]
MAEEHGTEIPVGERIKFFREASRRTKVSVAARADISVDYLYMIERGLKVPSTRVLYKLATILGVPVSALFSQPALSDGPLVHPAAPAVAAAMMDFGHIEAGQQVDLDQLRDRLASLHSTYQQSPNRYSDTLGLLPDLIRDIGRATRAFTAAGELEQRRQANRLAVDLYLLVRPVAKYLHRQDLMLLAGDRGVFYAEAADDPVRLAVAKWNLAQALSAHNEPESTRDVALTSAEELRPETERSGDDRAQTDALAVLGILQLMAAIADVRLGDHWSAMRRIREEALPIARRTGEQNAFWTVWGPANCLAYMVAVQGEVGEAAEALRLAEDLELHSLRSIERRASHLLELARCHEYRQEDAAVLLTLLRLEREAPEDLRYRSASHDLVRGVLNRARPSFAPEARDLARRIGLFA